MLERTISVLKRLTLFNSLSYCQLAGVQRVYTFGSSASETMAEKGEVLVLSLDLHGPPSVS